MALEMRHDLDAQTKIFTALGFGDKQTAEPFLSNARDAAYGQRSDTITLNAAGQAVVRSEVNGKAEPPSVIDFSNPTVSLPKSMHYDVGVDNEIAHVDLSAAIFGSENSFHVKAGDRTIDGKCSTKDGVSTCEETIKDPSGNVLLKGHTVADITKNPNDFHRTTDYSTPSGENLGRVSQHVVLDSKTNTLTAETTIAARKD